MGNFFGTLDFVAPSEAPTTSVQSRSTPSSLGRTSTTALAKASSTTDLALNVAKAST